MPPCGPARRWADLSQEPPPELVAGGAQGSPVATAARVGGAIAATAGAYCGTRALARRNARNDGKPLNSVMANAITACDLAHHKEAEPEPGASHEPAVAIEPPVYPLPLASSGPRPSRANRSTCLAKTDRQSVEW